ncbi:hypothetical protein BJY01DRAFT_214121 [Aspergillus pseudoustus]|uniref:BHLH domain-containing protein n=1 Tax=Aspergillus pseudoustus TaxID=1810923 RepID=A0ABR4JZI5_9EURO
MGRRPLQHRESNIFNPRTRIVQAVSLLEMGSLEARDRGIFGYIIADEYSDQQPLPHWASNEPLEAAPRKMDYGCTPGIDGFAFNINPSYQYYSEAWMISCSLLTDRAFDIGSNSEEANTIDGLTPIPAFCDYSTPPTDSLQSQMSILDGHGSVLTDVAKEKLHHLRWGSDRCFTEVGYAAPRDQLSEEDVAERLLQNNECWISYSSSFISREAVGALARVNMGIAIAPGLLNNGAARSREDYTHPTDSTESLSQRTGQVGRPRRPRLPKQKLRRGRRIGKAFNELQDLVPELKDRAPSKRQILNKAYGWIQQLVGDIETLRAQLDEIRAREGVQWAI